MHAMRPCDRTTPHHVRMRMRPCPHIRPPCGTSACLVAAGPAIAPTGEAPMPTPSPHDDLPSRQLPSPWCRRRAQPLASPAAAQPAGHDPPPPSPAQASPAQRRAALSEMLPHTCSAVHECSMRARSMATAFCGRLINQYRVQDGAHTCKHVWFGLASE